jgi:hypothetical protein
VHAGRGLTLRGEGEAGDANAAFDDAAEHIATRLRRYRKRVNEHHRALAGRERAQTERVQTARAYVLRAEPDEPPPAEPADTTTASPAFATVIAETQTEITRLSVGDAVMRMDLADQPVLMFRNATTGELNVVYRRGDGNIGWIDPGTP